MLWANTHGARTEPVGMDAGGPTCTAACESTGSWVKGVPFPINIGFNLAVEHMVFIIIIKISRRAGGVTWHLSKFCRLLSMLTVAYR
jgi:hypothetical protein